MTTLILPPRYISQLSILVKIKELYRMVYECRFQVDKKNRYGIHAEVEKRVLVLMEMGITASLASAHGKETALHRLRVQTEVAKHLVRLEYEMKVLSQKKYIALQELLVEVSKMSLGWERHTQKRRPH